MFCQAEPALDLGTFCAYLPPSVAEDWRDGAATETLRTSFLESYEESTGEPIDFDRLALYESAMLALRGLSYLWQQLSGWEVRTSQLIDLAFERLVNPDPWRSYAVA